MWSYPQESANLVTFTEEILNGKLHFLYSVVSNKKLHGLLCLNFKVLKKFEENCLQL